MNAGIVRNVNIPNALSLIRLAGVPLLFVLAGYEDKTWFLLWFIFLGLTDYFDGKLARLWKQESELGANLDSVADVFYYLSAAWFLYSLFPDYIQPNIIFLQLFFAVFIITLLTSWFKLGKILLLHTHLSRLCGVLVFVGMVASFYIDTTLFLRLVIIFYTLAMIEFMLIYFIRGDVSPDTRSVFLGINKDVNKFSN